MLDKIKIVSLDTIDIRNMTPVYERAKYYGPHDYSRWVFRDEHTRHYYKIWNETYVKSNNIISGLLSGFYDETTVPALKGLIFWEGKCRGYIMDDLGDVSNKGDMISDQNYNDYHNFILEKVKKTQYFPHDFCQKHVRVYKNGYSLMDLEGIYHIEEYLLRLKEHNDRGCGGKFINNLKFDNDLVKRVINKPLIKQDFLDMELHTGKGGKEVCLNNYQLKTIGDLVEFWGDEKNIEFTKTQLHPNNWQYFNCMLAEFRHNVGCHHKMGEGTGMTEEYYNNLKPMSDEEIKNFLKDTGIEFETGYVKHSFHRAMAMVGRLINNKSYIPFYMNPYKYGGHITNPIENINYISLAEHHLICIFG